MALDPVIDPKKLRIADPRSDPLTVCYYVCVCTVHCEVKAQSSLMLSHFLEACSVVACCHARTNLGDGEVSQQGRLAHVQHVSTRDFSRVV